MADIGHIAESVSAGLLTWNRGDLHSAAMAVVAEGGGTSDRIGTESVLNAEDMLSSSGFRVEDRRVSRTAQFIDVDYVQAGLTGSSGLFGYGVGRFQLNAYREAPEAHQGTLVDLYV